MSVPSDRNWGMANHPVLDTIPTFAPTVKEWRERVENTGRSYTDPFILRHNPAEFGEEK